MPSDRGLGQSRADFLIPGGTAGRMPNACDANGDDACQCIGSTAAFVSEGFVVPEFVVASVEGIRPDRRMKPAAVIFDRRGVLTGSAPLINEAAAAMFRERGVATHLASK